MKDFKAVRWFSVSIFNKGFRFLLASAAVILAMVFGVPFNASAAQMGGSIQGTTINVVPAAVSTFAGTAGVTGTTNGTGTAARFNSPAGMTTDGTNLYVADGGSYLIRKIVISTGVVTTIAGTGSAGSANGTGTAASFNFLSDKVGITTDGTNLYVADTGNHTIRQIVISTGVVTTIAGTTTSGSADGTGAAASFYYPHGITTDGTNLYVSDTVHSLIRKIVISTQVVTTIAGIGSAGSTNGTGTAASFNYPRGITTDGTNLYVVDSTNNMIRKIVISSLAVTTIAGTTTSGSADGTGTAASFYLPYGITTDGTNLYVADLANNTIRKIVISSLAVTTIAGTTTAGTADGIGTAASFSGPDSITTDGTNLYVTDSSNNTLRKLAAATYTVTTTSGTAAMVQNAGAVTVDAGVTVDSNASSITDGTVSITSGFASGDTLACTNCNSVDHSYNATTGILTFSGTATPANWQAIFRTVTIRTTSASTTARTVAFTIGSSIPYSGNNHFYEYISTAGSWTAGKSAAAARTLFGLQGYLATITTQAENDFIQQKLGADAWIGVSDEFSQINTATGATTYANQVASEGHWYWVTGPVGEIGTNFSNGNTSPVVVSGKFMNWNSGEPNNSSTTEHYGEIYSSAPSSGKWNDLPNTNSLGYVVEYGGMAGDPTPTLTANKTVNSSPASFTVTPSAGANGSISPSSAQSITPSSTTTFTVTPSAGYSASVGGTCGGTLSGTTYTTSAITAACTVIASFTAIPAPLPNCTYSLSNSTQTFSASGGSSSAGVNQNETNCINAGWTAAGSASWITLTSGSSGTASGTLNYSVSQNTTTASRSGSITITGHSNTAAITITQNALFTLSPSALNYGTVKTGESAVRSATVTNISGGSLTLSSVNITGADSGDFTLTNNCATLSTNGSCTLAVKFMPATAGSKTATLTVTANNVSFTTALTGTADNNATSLISVTPSEINSILESEFGNHWIISISNSGIASLLIQDIRLYGRSLNEYTVAGNCSVVLPQETCAITLATAYTSNEAKEASLVITSNASNAGRVEIPIRDASLCSLRSIAITPASATAAAGGATGGITVIAPDNCFWTTSSNVAWVNLAANNGWTSGNGTVNYTVSANTGNVSRIGTIEVAGIPHKVIQNGAGPTNSPLDISGHEFENNINAMYSAGVAAGDNFNPDNIATRGDIAAFIIKAIYGEDFSYTATPYFSDVPVDHPSFKYVQKLKDDGITQVEGIYGINDSLSRGQAAALIIRAIYRESFSYPATPYFSDVPVDHGFFRYIQKMKEREFTHVPTGGEYHPGQLIPRDELAAFITEAFLGMGH